MYLDTPEPPADPKAQRAADRRRLGTALKLAVGFIAILVVMFGVQHMIDWRPFAVAPREALGLPLAHDLLTEALPGLEVRVSAQGTDPWSGRLG